MENKRSGGELSRTMYFVFGLACGSLTVGWCFFHEHPEITKPPVAVASPDTAQLTGIKIVNETETYVSKPFAYVPDVTDDTLFARMDDTCEPPLVRIQVHTVANAPEEQICVLPPHTNLTIHVRLKVAN